MPRTKTAPIDKILDIADQFGLEAYRAYSGRGMYGRECIGIAIRGDDWTDEREVIAAARKRGIRGECTDNLGRGVIIYWPDIADPFIDDDSDGKDVT